MPPTVEAAQPEPDHQENGPWGGSHGDCAGGMCDAPPPFAATATDDSPHGDFRFGSRDPVAPAAVTHSPVQQGPMILPFSTIATGDGVVIKKTGLLRYEAVRGGFGPVDPRIKYVLCDLRGELQMLEHLAAVLLGLCLVALFFSLLPRRSK